jgi:NCAIR mutase (PurE)-related protein
MVPILVANAGDLPVAEEAAETLKWMGVGSQIFTDIGTEGPRRIQERLAEIGAHAVVVVVSGEGTLPSLICGYVSSPVISVPTSVGTGASLGGVTALLSMLNSSAANLAVVNVDGGFKAGYLAALIASQKFHQVPN